MATAATGSGPDFIGIGLQKAGTRWLYNQLEEHPDFWMPPIKELHFFDRPFPHRSMVDKGSRRSVGADAAGFQQLLESLRKSRVPDFDIYASLFSFSGGRLTGDITPAYSKLELPMIQAIAQRLPQVKVILMLRDPISRLWSNLNDALSRGKLDEAVVHDPVALRQVLHAEPYSYLSYPAQIYRRWAGCFPESRLRWFFLDDVIAEPEATRSRILQYLGGDPQQKSGELSLSHNPKTGRPRAALEGAMRDCLVAEFGDELRDCAQLFGGPAIGWLEKYGLA